MKTSPLNFLWMVTAVVIAAGNSLANAQVGSAGSAISIAGKLTSVKGQELTVEANSGPVVVKLVDKTIIRGEVPIKFSDIVPGMYVGATAAKQSDGVFRASRLNIFSEDQRGTGEGHRPLSSAPQSGLTMTNANVEAVEDVAVQDVKGRMLTLKYKDGEIKVLVPSDIPIVKRVLGDRAMLKPGAVVTIQATQTNEGSISASQITVRASET